MDKNQELCQLWKVIFNKEINDKQANYLKDQKINNLFDFCNKFKKENLENKNDCDLFDLLKILEKLGLSEENLLILFQTLTEYGLVSLEHLKIADDQDYEQFGLTAQQKAIIKNQIDQESIEAQQFEQVISSIAIDACKIPQIKIKLLELGVKSQENLFQLAINQLDGTGINKFKFKTQQDQFKLLKNGQSNQSSCQSKSQNISNQEQQIKKQEQIKNNEQMQNQEQIKIHPQTLCVINQQPKVSEIQILIQKSQQIGTKNGFTLYQYPAYTREKLNDVETYKSMIVIGQTGSGKTTLLNFFLNYYLDIKFTDNFRFILINEIQQGGSQAISQTQSVVIYYIKPFNGKQGIRLIDTPGFGDTRGIAHDEIVGKQIQNCFKKDVESLSAICFLVQSSNARLTPNQNYILSCILQMFGKDIIKNFVFMLTFCDAGDPQALEALKFVGDSKHPGCPVAQMIDQIQQPWFLKLNSSALMSPNTDQMITKFFWEIAIASFNEFYNKKLIRNLPQSLGLTQLVIKEREQLIIIIQNIRPKIDELLHLIENIKNIHQQIQCLDNKIVDSSNFKIKQMQSFTVKKYLEQGQYTTNCIICNISCHCPCEIPEDDNKAQCAAMENEYCTQCKNKCHWKQHKNMDFKFDTEQKEVDIEYAQLKKQFFDSKSSKTSKEQILDGLESKCLSNQIECMEMQSELMKSVNKLKEIAIQPACCKNQEEYVEIMIKEEMYNKKDGYLQRISQLQEMKANWQFIREASNNQGGIKITKEFIEKSIPKEKIKQSFFTQISKEIKKQQF